MSSILYYSNFCEHSKKLLKYLSSTKANKEIHFICIDKRVKEKDGKMYIVLENGQKIIMPENVSKVPAILLLKENYKVLYGDNIYEYLKPKQEVIVRESTNNNMEPMAFSLGGGGGFGGGIVSDNYSFLDMNADSLNVKGDGGMRQMHNYVPLDNNGMGVGINTPKDEFDYKSSKMPEGLTIEQLQKQRESEISNFGKR